MMSADEPGFDVAEQGMDNREELAGIGCFALDHRHVLQMLAEAGVTTAIAGKPVGQEMGSGCNVRLEEGAEFGARRGRQHGDPGVAGEEPVLALDRMAVFSLLVLWRRHLLDRGNNQALVGVGRGLAVLRPELVGSPRPPMKVSSASRNPRSTRVGSSLSPWRNLCAMVQAVWYATTSSRCRNLAETPRLSRPIR